MIIITEEENSDIILPLQYHQYQGKYQLYDIIDIKTNIIDIEIIIIKRTVARSCRASRARQMRQVITPSVRRTLDAQ